MAYRNRIGQVTTTTGTGAITLGAAITDSTNGNLQALGAGDDGASFTMLIIDGAAWEISTGVYTHDSLQFSRATLVESSTGSAIDLSGDAKCYVTVGAADMKFLPNEITWDNTEKTLNIDPTLNSVSSVGINMTEELGSSVEIATSIYIVPDLSAASALQTAVGYAYEADTGVGGVFGVYNSLQGVIAIGHFALVEGTSEAVGVLLQVTCDDDGSGAYGGEFDVTCGTNSAATGIQIEAIGDTGSTVQGIEVSASGGDTNLAINVTAGDVDLGSGTILIDGSEVTDAGVSLIAAVDAAAQREVMSAGYTLGIQCGNLVTPTDATTYYFGGASASAPGATNAEQQGIIPRAGIIKACYVGAHSTTVGSDESWELFIRINDTTDYSIGSVASTDAFRVWSSTSLDISVSAGDTYTIKTTTPTWGTDPANVRFRGSLYIE